MSKLFVCWKWVYGKCNLKRKTRIAPSDPPRIVPVSSAGAARGEGEESGEINRDFTIDDEEIINVVNSLPDGGQNQPSSQVPFDYVDSSGDSPAVDLHLTDFPKTADGFFLEIGKKKKIWVVHIKPREDDDDNLSNLSTDDADGEDDDDDDEEYWFSKWRKRPRLKNTFNPEQAKKSASGQNKNNVNNGDGKLILTTIEGLPIRRTPSRLSLQELVDTDIKSSKNVPPLENTSVAFNKKTLMDETREEIEKMEIKKKEPNLNTPTKQSQSDTESGIENLGFQSDEDDDIESDNKDHIKIESIQLCLNKKDEIKNNNNNKTDYCESNSVVNENSEKKNEKVPPGNKIKSVGEIIEDQDRDKNRRISKKEEKKEESPPPSKVRKKPLLIFIHGISGTLDIWNRQLKYFEERGFEIVAFDLLGHGFSSSPSNNYYYTFESLFQDLLYVFDHFVHEDRKCVLIGHAYGSCLASVLTRVRPKNVVILISLSGGGPTPMIPNSCCQNSWFPFLCSPFGKKFDKGRYDDPEQRHILPPKIRQKIFRGQIWIEGDSAFHRRITIPTLLVYGMKDKVINLVEECEMERTIQRAFLEIFPDAGHMIMWDVPARLSKMMLAFIKTWPC